MITLPQLKKIMPYAGTRAAVYLPALNDAMAEFGIDTTTRQAAFLAQICHESGSLRYVRELASGAAYEGRSDLGNTEPGDGIRFKGRGLIQITGRANYRACGLALGLPLEEAPHLLEQVGPACRSAGWFWRSRGLNAVADRGDLKAVTRRINGGLNGFADRLAAWERASTVLA
jgi:putative chitinase